jgi:hypothetical protein
MSLINLELQHEKLDKLKRIYEFETGGVEEYIKSQVCIIEDLIEASEQIKLIFPKNIKLSLKIQIDPENSSENLFVVIRSKSTPRESFNKLIEIFEKTDFVGLDITHRPI